MSRRALSKGKSRPIKTKPPAAAFGASVAKKGTGNLKPAKGKLYTVMGKG